MRKLISLISIFAVVLSCSSDETSTPVTPPPAPIVKYTITLSAGEGGAVSTTGGEYEAGQTVSVTATPQGEYVFTSWSDGNTNATRTITVSSNSTLTANFEKRKYPLTLNIEGEGEVLEEIVNAGRTTDYDSGTTVKLTAVPAEGWEFIGWTGAIESTELEVQLLVGEAKEVNAEFKKIPLISKNGDLTFSQPSTLGVGNNTENHIRNNYEITKKGWLGSVIDKFHNGGFYGTQVLEPGYFMLNHKMILTTDLNNDGLEDMILDNSYLPHTISLSANFKPFFSLINNGDGTFLYSDDYFEDAFSRPGDNSYRFIIDDFNNDGRPDFFTGMTAGPEISTVDGSTNAKEAFPILAISNSSGGYSDFSKNLNLSNDMYWISDRGLASGDFNGDGYIDLFMSYKIIYNNGQNNFSLEGEQLSDIMVPGKLNPASDTNPYDSNTYEAYSDDFNNDGFDDIVIAPDSGFIKNKGGSGWIVMSNGTSNVSEWNKILLPDPIYPNNTKLNHIKTIDFNKDGFKDLVIASTRDTPYYSGVGIQLLRNNGNNAFEDVTQTNVSDQSHLNSYGIGTGEGTLYILDVNNDGIDDILHSTANWDVNTSINIYLNNNGYLELYDTTNNIPFLDWTQFIGKENFRNNPNAQHNVLDFAFPININNDGWIDFISFEKEITDKEFNNVFYTIESKSN